MARLDLRLLKLTLGDHRWERIDLDVEPFAASSLTYAAAPQTFTADLGITRLSEGMLFDLAFTTDVTGPCQRCLDDAKLSISVRGDEYQATVPQGEGDSEVCEYLEGEILDVDRWARDAIILALPIVVVCKVGCAGLCARCGANLNAGLCACPPPEPDPRWQALRGLELPSSDG